MASCEDTTAATNLRARIRDLDGIRNSVKSRVTFSRTVMEIQGGGDGHSFRDYAEPKRIRVDCPLFGCKHIYSRRRRKDATIELKKYYRDSLDSETRRLAGAALRYTRIRVWLREHPNRWLIMIAATVASAGLVSLCCSVLAPRIRPDDWYTVVAGVWVAIVWVRWLWLLDRKPSQIERALGRRRSKPRFLASVALTYLGLLALGAVRWTVVHVQVFLR